MTVVTRFAPSPTGRLHVGNLRTALHNWLWAKKHGGRCLLRLDDTDLARSTVEFADAIQTDLAWFGTAPDGMVRQSERFDLYERRFEELRAAGHVYPAYETQDELDLKRKVLAGRGLPPIYDRAALRLSDEERAALEAKGIAPHWRFKLDHTAPIAWYDLVRGHQKIDPALQSDPVIRRADGSWLYMLPSVIDDIDMGVTHVVRGEDHVTNTGLQLQMFAALGATAPAFAHEALLVGSEGKLSKRLGSLGADAFREEGIEPLALAALLARIGTSDPVEPVTGLDTLSETLDFARFGRAPARFDLEELKALNAKMIHLLPYAAVADRLPSAIDAAAWPVIAPNLTRIDQASDWVAVLAGEIDAPAVNEEDGAYLATAARVAAEIDWSAEPWAALTNRLKQETGRKGKGLFLPLRQALTGHDHGPDMASLLPLIGQARVVARLERAAA
ncbi:glutamyl-tRNA synthetase [Sphingomonas vulcanisoli]|uniref:Glutamate--tRNA ligase n=1 Tax=Sphingomonas vulcanisoli TaxID=1658060 RepID=A0ABX0TX39_9SPHN|nr:glutamate--tRNA ligase [Sphingomonas vulcanisoli]NIJ08350.1 glutamyl-tRNA synthetase [Sphingomonas vulcanisoli]